MGQSLFTITNILVGITVGISMMLMQNREGKSSLIFHPVSIKEGNQYHRFLTSGFIHADGMHLAINMFVLWSFGNAIESYYYPAALGQPVLIKFLLLYLGGIVVASIPSYFRHKDDPRYMALGASGGVSAVVFAWILFAPWQNLYLYGALPIPQILAGGAYLYYSWYKDKNSTDNIGHMAHFTGAVWGFFITIMMRPDLLTRFIQLTFEGPSRLGGR